ncbi:MAG TPA: Flp family type IVb pilin [Candidatus Brocadiia bacterium]|nr:Flp family type IVb pilin [Candidatus Brocadiia bacterium]
MRKLARQTEKGQGLVEYALCLIIVMVVLIGATSAIGEWTKGPFEKTSEQGFEGGS